MKKVILFGATGNIGKAIAREVLQGGYRLLIVVRNKNKAEQLSHITTSFVVADITAPGSLSDICQGQDIVISALGKSVSPNDRSRQTFREIDFVGNSNILQEAKASGVKKFVYVSAFHSERYLHLNYCRVHHEFAELLKYSGIDYTIIKPPAVFSAFLDMIEMAKKGQLITIGAGDKKTNPIYEGDLAKVCVDSIKHTKAVVEAGGKVIYTRHELNELVQIAVNPKKKVRHIPLGLMKTALPLIRLFDKNMYDKFSFFIEVTQQDTVAPQLGEMRFEDYIRSKVKV
ncbi:SDR family oxidoreductase [Pontibacter pamirensis]|uniref:SDR family oxidoreductase n=1 Tax=Pontibacter pamirensis TaxID=2562824 RepID=UPI00138A167F|nr:SDR family oxidoreductase [Pontibacter pamirensis]